MNIGAGLAGPRTARERLMEEWQRLMRPPAQSGHAPKRNEVITLLAIEVKHLSKRFDEFQALSDVSFSVEDGETFGFLGPNGAGKTTTIRILTGISAPTEGTATIFGRDIVRETIAARKLMGIVSETSNIYDDLTAWRNLMFSAELYGIGRSVRERRGQELLELFGLWPRKDDKARGFSKGMKRRLTLAMGLINEPKLLFLDEPTSGLDVQSNLIIRDIIRDLNSKQVTVFLTTHNIEEANLICDRVAIINKGRIAAIDSPEKLKGTIQSVQSVEVAFDHTSPDLMEALRSVARVSEVRKEGDKFRLFTEDPSVVIAQLTGYADQQGNPIVSLNTYGPSLEDVFIKLTGLDVRTRGVGTSE
jgi:ABC-2 type transport system ATP-binding protein